MILNVLSYPDYFTFFTLHVFNSLFEGIFIYFFIILMKIALSLSSPQLHNWREEKGFGDREGVQC